MALYDRESMLRVFELIQQMRDRLSAAIDEASEGIPLGFGKLNDEEFVFMFESRMGISPPVEIVDPAGFPAVASPWVAMLPLTENGDALLRLYERLKGRDND